MVSITLFQNVFKVCVFIVFCCPSLQLLPMHHGRNFLSTSLTELDGVRSPAKSTHDLFLEVSRISSALQMVLGIYELIFHDDAYYDWMEDDLCCTAAKFQLNYPLPQKCGDEIKKIIEENFKGVTVEKLQRGKSMNINGHKQKVCDYYLFPKYREKRLANFGKIVHQIYKLIDALADKHRYFGQELEMLPPLLAAKAHLEEQECEGYDDSASVVLNWFLDICRGLKEKLHPVQSVASLALSSSSAQAASKNT